MSEVRAGDRGGRTDGEDRRSRRDTAPKGIPADRQARLLGLCAHGFDGELKHTATDLD
jgi:hypothetical protein